MRTSYLKSFYPFELTRYFQKLKFSKCHATRYANGLRPNCVLIYAKSAYILLSKLSAHLIWQDIFKNLNSRKHLKNNYLLTIDWLNEIQFFILNVPLGCVHFVTQRGTPYWLRTSWRRSRTPYARLPKFMQLFEFFQFQQPLFNIGVLANVIRGFTWKKGKKNMELI